MSDSEQFLTVTPLGGLGEIGLNCQLWETSAGVVLVDCGLMISIWAWTWSSRISAP